MMMIGVIGVAQMILTSSHDRKWVGLELKIEEFRDNLREMETRWR